MTSVVPTTVGLIAPTLKNEVRNGANPTVTTTAAIPDMAKNTQRVRMRSATPSRSPTAIRRATRWTAAVLTPRSRRIR